MDLCSITNRLELIKMAKETDKETANFLLSRVSYKNIITEVLAYIHDNDKFLRYRNMYMKRNKKGVFRIWYYTDTGWIKKHYSINILTDLLEPSMDFIRILANRDKLTKNNQKKAYRLTEEQTKTRLIERYEESFRDAIWALANGNHIKKSKPKKKK